MKLIMSMLAATMILGLSQCKNKKEVNDAPEIAAVEEATEETIENPAGNKVQYIVIDPTYEPRDTDPYTIKEVTLEGDILAVVVSYGGGCRDHEFTMISNQQILKSLPPQLYLTLEHENNDDNCRAMIQQTLKFDVSNVKHAGSDAIRLLVNGSREHEVVYEYGK